MTMANVPWHEEVVQFVKLLVEQLDDYEIASEHAHSNCLLIAHKKVCNDFSRSITLLTSNFEFKR